MDLQAVLRAAAQKAVMKNLASHDGNMQFFRPLAKPTYAAGTKPPKKSKNLGESHTSGIIKSYQTFENTVGI